MNTAPVKTFNREKGSVGETIATAFLIKHGFHLVEMNYKNKIGEIDIIAKKKNARTGENVLHFIEVKYRTTLDYGGGRESVGIAKQNKIRKVAQGYLGEKRLYDNVSISFDVIDIVGSPHDHEIEHLEGCF